MFTSTEYELPSNIIGAIRRRIGFKSFAPSLEALYRIALSPENEMLLTGHGGVNIGRIIEAMNRLDDLTLLALNNVIAVPSLPLVHIPLGNDTSVFISNVNVNSGGDGVLESRILHTAGDDGIKGYFVMNTTHIENEAPRSFLTIDNTPEIRGWKID